MRKVIICLVTGMLIGFLICSVIVVFCSTYNHVDYSKTYGIAELLYYVTQPLGVLGTFLAIIVAIFGTEIQNVFFSPKCKVTINDAGFTEELGATSSATNPIAQNFLCTLKLENTGSKELIDLQLVIKDVYYYVDNKKPKKISKQPETVLFWGRPENKKINLRKTETKEFVVSRILPEASEGTPDGTKQSPLRFSLTGVNLDSKYNKKGHWVVNYCLQTPQKIIESFQIEFTWSGLWRNRLTEMVNEVSAKIK